MPKKGVVTKKKSSAKKAVTKLELGCGYQKRDGFFGIDILKTPAVDLVLDIEKKKLPFPDNSIDYIYSSHTFEHLTNYQFVIQEMFRVCKPNAVIEIWTPYGKSNDGMLFGHYTFLSETSFKHIAFEYDRFFFEKAKGYFLWEKTQYTLYPGIVESLKKMKIPFDFALEHMFNIALEWGVFMRVKKDAPKAPGPQYPGKVFTYGGRTDVVKVGLPDEVNL